MTDQDEKLSLLLDDYAAENPDAELERVIDDVNLQYRLRRYRMIGEVMRHELPGAIDTGFHSSVMARVRQEADVAKTAVPDSDSTGPVSSIFNWGVLKPFAGIAVAASVAVVTVALWQPVKQEIAKPDELAKNPDQQRIEQLAGQKPKDGVVQASTRVQSLGTRWKVDREMPGLQQKLNAYLVNHTEYSNPVQGLIPQARVAGFDSQQ